MRNESDDAEFMKRLDGWNHNKNLGWHNKDDGRAECVQLFRIVKRFLKKLKIKKKY